MKLPTPAQIKRAFPLSYPDQVSHARSIARKIIERTDPRIAVITGPCSIHDEDSAIEYAERLKELMPQVDSRFFLVMRVFIEKPRSGHGWKGLLYDPDLDGTYNIASGIQKSREILLNIANRGVAIATELLDPIAAPYFDDLISWGLIGARTAASQPHRQMASGLPFPVGFKNDCEGRIDSAISAISVAQMPHNHLGIDEEGHVAALKTAGNPLSHLVLRGSDTHPNYDSIPQALAALRKHHLQERIVIDCSHGNSNKKPHRQKPIFESLLTNAHPALAGLMLESHLFEGKQTLPPAHYGVSITDPCMGWEETRDLLLSMSMSSVQN